MMGIDRYDLQHIDVDLSKESLANVMEYPRLAMVSPIFPRSLATNVHLLPYGDGHLTKTALLPDSMETGSWVTLN